MPTQARAQSDPCDRLEFQTPQVYNVGASCANPGPLAIGDLVGVNASGQVVGPDGRPDIVVVDRGCQKAVVFANLLGTSDPEFMFSIVHTLSVGVGVFDVEIADVDKQNGNDIIVNYGSDRAIVMLLNDGNGQFTSTVQCLYPAPTHTTSLWPGLLVSELDGQDGPDIAQGLNLENPALPGMGVLRHNPGPGAQCTDFSFGWYPATFPDFKDFPTDNVASELGCSGPGLDMALVSNNSPGLFLLHRSTPGPWTGVTLPLTAVPAKGLAAGLFRLNTSARDLAMTHLPPEEEHTTLVQCSRSMLCGDFDIDIQLDVGFVGLQDPWGIAAGRIDDEVRVDLAVACEGGTTHAGGGIAIFLGAGSANIAFDGPCFVDVQPGAFPSPRFVKLGDLDGNSTIDLAVTTRGDDVPGQPSGSAKLIVILNNRSLLP